MAIDAKQVLWGAVGAGSKGVVAGITGGVAPEMGIAPDIVTGAVGFGLAQWGKGAVADFGVGMLLASIGQMIKTPLEKLFGNLFPPNGNGEKVAAAAQAAAPQNAVLTTAGYISSRYGLN